VGGRSAVVRLAGLPVDTRVEQDALGRGGLTGIDVRHDADVADLVEVSQHVLCHGFSPIVSRQWPVRSGSTVRTVSCNWVPARTLGEARRGLVNDATRGAATG